MKVRFLDKKFKNASLLVIAKANVIIEEYQNQGYSLTIRQLYYQFVARDEFPDSWLVNIGDGKATKNHERNYKKLIQLMTNARLAGLVAWDAIVDRTRSTTLWKHHTSPSESLKELIQRYNLDPWENQPMAVEIWVEKEALAGVFDRVAKEFSVPYFSCRGYHSASSAWDARNRLLNRYQERGQQTLVLHFGDHDPSGLDMTRDIEDRFAVMGVDDEVLRVNRVSLNMDQIRELNPPPSPAKPGDSRTPGYEITFGTSDTWELDAVDAGTLADMAREEIELVIDPEKRSETEQQEERDEEALHHALASLDSFNPDA